MRPSSSLSTSRPTSRLSQRPQSRLARHQTRIQPFCASLVRVFLGDPGDDDERRRRHDQVVDHVVRHTESTTLTKAASSLDLKTAEKIIHGHSEKARIMSREHLAAALDRTMQDLTRTLAVSADLDQEIKLSHLPDHLQFLFALSNAPTAATTSYAEYMLQNEPQPRNQPDALTWNAIIADEPFTGEHWEGILTERDSYGGSPTSLSPYSSDPDDDDESSSPFYALEKPSQPPSEPETSLKQPQFRPSHAYAHRWELEDIQARQYWRSPIEGPLGNASNENSVPACDVGNPANLGTTLKRIFTLDNSIPFELLRFSNVCIDEHDAVREVLLALQGRENVMFERDGEEIKITSHTPSLRHFSPSSQISILTSLACTATTLQRLRTFSWTLINQGCHGSASSKRPNLPQTLEAFADAVYQETLLLDTWCAEREVEACSALAGVLPPSGKPLVLSLLSLENSLRNTFSHTYDILLEVAKEWDPESHTRKSEQHRMSPSATSVWILDRLFALVQKHLERSDSRVSKALMRVFIIAAEPTWGMVGSWLRNGMNVASSFGQPASTSSVGEGMGDLDDEFFIECNSFGPGVLALGLFDPDFWTEGYTLRTASDKKSSGIPIFLQHIAESILQAGKARGLLKVLGFPDAPFLLPKMEELWTSFGDLVSSLLLSSSDSLSIDTISSLIHRRVSPTCVVLGTSLMDLVMLQCELCRHIASIEDLYFMRRGDVLTHFCDALFEKIDTEQRWTDFHSLNTALADSISASFVSGEWIEPSLVRASYRMHSAWHPPRSVRNLDGIRIDYAVPFPLIYILTPDAVMIYNKVFVFLLQLRRAKSALERVLLSKRGDARQGYHKVYYALRIRLSWFINAFLNFLVTHVVQIQSGQLRAALETAQTLDEAIRTHNAHLFRLEYHCLLHDDHEPLHRTILSILDMTVGFSDALVTTYGAEQNATSLLRTGKAHRHRSRRNRQRRRNGIGFHHCRPQFEETSSSDDEVGEVEAARPNGEEEHSTREGESFKLDEMWMELDGLVRSLRRGVEHLAGKPDASSPTFGVLSFILEEWDL